VVAMVGFAFPPLLAMSNIALMFLQCPVGSGPMTLTGGRRHRLCVSTGRRPVAVWKSRSLDHDGPPK
jgi:hypothetical protein